MRVFRWYINRKYSSQKTEKKGTSYIEVTIIPENDKYSSPLHPENMQDITKLNNDKLEWWQKDEENQLEGWTREETLIDALRVKNIFSESAEMKAAPQERGIEEDMVFLHFVSDEKEMEKIWANLKKQKAFPDLGRLIEIEKALWLDFTQQARRMSSTLYHRALGEKQEDTNASE